MDSFYLRCQIVYFSDSLTVFPVPLFNLLLILSIILLSHSLKHYALPYLHLMTSLSLWSPTTTLGETKLSTFFPYKGKSLNLTNCCIYHPLTDSADKNLIADLKIFQKENFPFNRCLLVFQFPQHHQYQPSILQH